MILSSAHRSSAKVTRRPPRISTCTTWQFSSVPGFAFGSSGSSFCLSFAAFSAASPNSSSAKEAINDSVSIQTILLKTSREYRLTEPPDRNITCSSFTETRLPRARSKLVAQRIWAGGFLAFKRGMVNTISFLLTSIYSPDKAPSASSRFERVQEIFWPHWSLNRKPTLLPKPSTNFLV